MKKILITLGIVAALSAVVTGSLALYVYNLDLGVDYKGRARLDYNWKYHFAACPKEEYKYEGKLFSFSYPKFQKQDPLQELGGGNSSGVSSDDWLFDIFWDKSTPKQIKSELLGYLSLADGKAFPPPSQGFVGWLVLESDEKYFNFDKTYSTNLRKVIFRDGGTAILLSLSSKVEQRPHRKFVVGIFPSGDVFVVRNTVRFNASEASYIKYGMNPLWQEVVPPDAARDARSACVLNRFLQTFEFKK